MGTQPFVRELRSYDLTVHDGKSRFHHGRVHRPRPGYFIESRGFMVNRFHCA